MLNNSPPRSRCRSAIPLQLMLALLLSAWSLPSWSQQAPKSLDVKSLRSAAEGGDARAQVILGKAYLLGEMIDRDDDQGVFWLRQAARQSDKVAQAWFGWAYENGRGVRKDPQRAYSWYSRSARQGYEWAAQQRDRLKVGHGAMAGTLNATEREQPVVTRRAAQPDNWRDNEHQPVAAGSGRPGSEQHPDPMAIARPDTDSDPGLEQGLDAPDQVSIDPQTIAGQLRDWVVTNLKTDMPDRVKADELAIVTLELPTPPELEQWQAAGIGVRVQADLQVDGTVVEPLTKPEQALRPHYSVKWRWQIRAVEGGVPLFDLALRGRVLVPDHEPVRVDLIRLGPRVSVQPSWTQRIWKLILENQLAIGLTVLVPLFLWLGMSFAGRRKAKAE